MRFLLDLFQSELKQPHSTLDPIDTKAALPLNLLTLKLQVEGTGLKGMDTLQVKQG